MVLGCHFVQWDLLIQVDLALLPIPVHLSDQLVLLAQCCLEVPEVQTGLGVPVHLAVLAHHADRWVQLALRVRLVLVVQQDLVHLANLVYLDFLARLVIQLHPPDQRHHVVLKVELLQSRNFDKTMFLSFFVLWLFVVVYEVL